jgi:hypothetical protein
VPDVGVPYLKAGTAINTFYSPLPEAYIKLAPTDTLSVQAGKLPTLIGAEYTFSFENMNVERGLVWNLEPQISDGAQVNYTKGPLAFSLSVNDGFYSHKWNWITGAATWTINAANTLEFVGGGSLSTNRRSSYETVVPLNNSSIYNLIYTYTSGPWTVTPYAQYTHVDALPFAGTTAASSYAGALLVKYSFTSSFSVAARGEYVDTSGNKVTAANFLYGPGSDAWSLTITPTYQFKIFFLRAEASYVKASSTTPGSVFGPLGTQTSQTRILGETGILF